MHQSRPHNPGYGKITSICKSLGYGAESKKDPRYYYKLRKSTAEFRKEFLLNSSLQEFTLDYNSSQARQCAGNFLKTHLHLFPFDTDAIDNGWPTYPRNADEIHVNLARLMCAQEYTRQSNAIYKHNHEVNEQILSSESRDGTEETIDPSQLTSYHDGLVAVSQRKAAKRASAAINAVEELEEDYMLSPTPEVEDPPSSETVREKIDGHLRFVYPLDGTPDGTDSEWLRLRSAAWPKDLIPFAWRYLHERNLYDFGKDRAIEIHQFVGALKAKLNFSHSCTEDEDARIFQKVSNFARYQVSPHKVKSNKAIESYGLLIEGVVTGAVYKSPMFEECWNERRKSWIAKVHNDVIDDVIELRMGPSPPNTTKHVLKLKMPSCHELDASRSVDFEMSLAAKRQKIGERTDLYPSESPISPKQDMHTATITVSTSPNNLQRAPEALMTSYISSESEKPDASPTAALPSPSQLDALITNNKCIPPPQLSDTITSLNDHPNGPQLCAEAEVPTSPTAFGRKRGFETIGGDALPSQRLHESPTPQPTIYSPSSTPATDGNRNSAPPPRQSWVQFFVESFPGALNQDAIQLDDFKNAELSDFLNLTRVRRLSPAAEIRKLIFVETWKPNNTYQLNAFSSEIEWQEIKDRLRNDCFFRRTYLKAGEVLRIWVKCEAENVVTLDDDDDDDRRW